MEKEENKDPLQHRKNKKMSIFFSTEKREKGRKMGSSSVQQKEKKRKKTRILLGTKMEKKGKQGSSSAQKK